MLIAYKRIKKLHEEFIKNITYLSNNQIFGKTNKNLQKFFKTTNLQTILQLMQLF